MRHEDSSSATNRPSVPRRHIDVETAGTCARLERLRRPDSVPPNAKQHEREADHQDAVQVGRRCNEHGRPRESTQAREGVIELAASTFWHGAPRGSEDATTSRRSGRQGDPASPLLPPGQTSVRLFPAPSTTHGALQAPGRPSHGGLDPLKQIENAQNKVAERTSHAEERPQVGRRSQRPSPGHSAAPPVCRATTSPRRQGLYRLVVGASSRVHRQDFVERGTSPSASRR